MKRARKVARLSQARLAERAGVARATIYRLESGDRVFRDDTLAHVARGLRLPIHVFDPDWLSATETDAVRLGAETRRRRRELGLSLRQLAEIAGVSEATLSRHERGKVASPKLVRFEDGVAAAHSPLMEDALRAAAEERRLRA